MTTIPGWDPGLMIAQAAAGPTTLAFFDDAVSNGTTITHPAGILAGDLIIILHRASDSDNTVPPDVTPSGHTLIGSTSAAPGGGFSWKQMLHGKVAVGTESGTSVNVLTGSDSGGSPDQRSLMAIFRGDSPINSFSAEDVAGESTTGNPASQTVLSGAGVVPLIALGAWGAFVVPEVIPMSPAADGSVTNAPGGSPSGGLNGIYLEYKIYNSSPANVVVDADDYPKENSNSLQSCYIEVS